MPVLRPDALLGRTVIAPPGLGLEALGAVSTEDAWADLVVADLRHRLSGIDSVAAVTGEAFARARAAETAAGDRGFGILFLLPRGGLAEETLTAAVVSFARTAAVEWAPRRIRVNCLVGSSPDVVAYFASPLSAMMTGQLIEVHDG